MRFFTVLSLVAAFALVGAGCANTTDQNTDEMSADVQEEMTLLGYDEGIERTFVGNAQGSKAMVYSGQQVISGTFAYDAHLGAICFELAAEEAVKLPQATGGDLEHYCVYSGATVLSGDQEVALAAGEGEYRIGRVEVTEVGGANLWSIEVLEEVVQEVAEEESEEEVEGEGDEVDEMEVGVEVEGGEEGMEIEVEVVE